jgi:hypothetical protein
MKYVAPLTFIDLFAGVSMLRMIDKMQQWQRSASQWLADNPEHAEFELCRLGISDALHEEILLAEMKAQDVLEAA